MKIADQYLIKCNPCKACQTFCVVKYIDPSLHPPPPFTPFKPL